MLECFKDCFLFVGRANEFLALALADVVIESFLKTALLFDLGNVEGGHLQTEVFQNICLYLWIGGGGSGGLGQVCNIYIKVDMFGCLFAGSNKPPPRNAPFSGTDPRGRPHRGHIPPR